MNGKPTALPTWQVIGFLVDNLGRRLTEVAAGTSSAALMEAYASGRNLNVEQEARLRTAHQAFNMIAKCDGPHIARAWMIGMNPHLDDENPILCIANGRYRDALMAARTYAKHDTFG